MSDLGDALREVERRPARPRIPWRGLLILILIGGAVAAASVAWDSLRRETAVGLPAIAPPELPEWEFPVRSLMQANPTPDNPRIRRLGEQRYVESCAECHGTRGNGEGAKARLDPAPSNLRQVVPEYSDAYLFLRITHGKLGTAMPSFVAIYPDPSDRWALVRFLRTLEAE